MKGKLWKTLRKPFEDSSILHREKSVLFSHLQGGVLEFERLEFLAPSSDQNLTSPGSLS